jgi:hypothetical protein
MKEKRRFERREYHEAVNVIVSVLEFKEIKKLHLKGRCIDISESGLGIQIDYPLELGHVPLLTNGIGLKVGIVKWSKKFEDTYRTGIQFLPL